MENKINTEAENDASPGGINGTLEIIARDELLSMLAEVIQTTHTKITSGRIRDLKKEKIRLESVRVLGYICSVYSGVLKDRDLSDIERRLEALENNGNK